MVKTTSTMKMHDFEISMDQIGVTSYEKARIIGARALQLSQGAMPKVKLSEEELQSIKFNPIEIAKKEFDEGVIPIGVKRIHD
ncbi:MAG: DNA-directed RNA polymerase subunit K [Candidatus Woesearchaeota archaeon]